MRAAAAVRYGTDRSTASTYLLAYILFVSRPCIYASGLIWQRGVGRESGFRIPAVGSRSVSRLPNTGSGPIFSYRLGGHVRHLAAGGGVRSAPQLPRKGSRPASGLQVGGSHPASKLPPLGPRPASRCRVRVHVWHLRCCKCGCVWHLSYCAWGDTCHLSCRSRGLALASGYAQGDPTSMHGHVMLR